MIVIIIIIIPKIKIQGIVMLKCSTLLTKVGKQ